MPFLHHFFLLFLSKYTAQRPFIIIYVFLSLVKHTEEIWHEMTQNHFIKHIIQYQSY